MALKISNDLRDCVRDLFYPIGMLFISNKNVNPSISIGGTWVAVTNDYLLNFITSGTGGAYSGNSNVAVDNTTLSVAQMPVHTHIQNVHNHGIYSGYGEGSAGTDAYRYQFWASASLGWHYGQLGTGDSIASNQNTGGGGAHNHGLNLKKLNMYGWIRTA